MKSYFTRTYPLALVIFMSLAFSCSSESVLEEICVEAGTFLFVEKDGYINIEFENADFSGDWKLKNNGSTSGKGYMVWEGEQYLHRPEVGFANYTIKIQNPGTYRFVWKSAVLTGTNGTDHNDTWLRFADADNFYGSKNENERVYPEGTGKSPNPAGASHDGWFKIYRGGNNLDFKWQSSTNDHDAHDIYVDFQTAGIYTMEVAPRSSGHGIDNFVLFKDMEIDAATSENNELSEIECIN